MKRFCSNNQHRTSLSFGRHLVADNNSTITRNISNNDDVITNVPTTGVARVLPSSSSSLSSLSFILNMTNWIHNVPFLKRNLIGVLRSVLLLTTVTLSFLWISILSSVSYGNDHILNTDYSTTYHSTQQRTLESSHPLSLAISSQRRTNNGSNTNNSNNNNNISFLRGTFFELSEKQQQGPKHMSVSSSGSSSSSSYDDGLLVVYGESDSERRGRRMSLVDTSSDDRTSTEIIDKRKSTNKNDNKNKTKNNSNNNDNDNKNNNSASISHLTDHTTINKSTSTTYADTRTTTDSNTNKDRLRTAGTISSSISSNGRNNLNNLTESFRVLSFGSAAASILISTTTRRTAPKLDHEGLSNHQTNYYNVNKNDNLNEGSFSDHHDQIFGLLPYPVLLDQYALNVAAVADHIPSDAAVLYAACTQTIVTGGGGSSSNSVRRSSTGTKYVLDDDYDDDDVDTSTYSARSNTIVDVDDDNDDEYNVITIEYEKGYYTKSHYVLVQRLQKRYPQSVIVLVEIPNPLTEIYIRRTDDGTSATATKDLLSLLSSSSNDEEIKVNQDEENDFFIATQALIDAVVDAVVVDVENDGGNLDIFPASTTKTTMDTSTSSTEIHERFKRMIVEQADNIVVDSVRSNDRNNSSNNLLKQTFEQSGCNGIRSSDGGLEDNDEYDHHCGIILYNLPYPTDMKSYNDVSNFMQLFDFQLVGNQDTNLQQSTSSRSSESSSNKDKNSPQYDFSSKRYTSALSNVGHERVAKDIRDIALRQQSSKFSNSTVYQNQDDNVSSSTSSGIVSGTWGSGDNCHIWYDTGLYDLTTTATPSNVLIPFYSNNAATSTISNSGNEKSQSILMTETRTSSSSFLLLSSSSSSSSIQEQQQQQQQLHKHVLEFTYDHLDTVMIHNPFHTERMLYLTYMTDDINSYPRTRVWLNGSPTVVIEPFHDDYDLKSNTGIPTTSSTTRGASTSKTGHNDIHQDKSHDPLSSSFPNTLTMMTTRTSAVGYIPAGTDSVVTLEILPPYDDSLLPFRLVGASILADEVVHMMTSMTLRETTYGVDTDEGIDANDDNVNGFVTPTIVDEGIAVEFTLERESSMSTQQSS